MVLIIAALHAVPVLLVTMVSDSVRAVWATVGIMVGIGFLLGDPAYSLLDAIAAIGAGVWGQMYLKRNDWRSGRD